MKAVTVDVSLLRELLATAYRNASIHQDDQHERFVLGQLDATANFVYALFAGIDEPEFEMYCQQLAVEAMDRYQELIAQDTVSDRADG